MRRLLLLSTVIVCLAAGLVGCGFFHQVRYGFGAMTRDEADYDALDAEREATGGLGATADALPPAYWAQYRGPRGDGIYTEQELALDWTGEPPPELWRVAVGPAYSSVVVADGLVITLEQRRDREALVAFALEGGAPVWEHSWEGRFYERMSKEGPRSTPAVKDGAVVAVGATGELRCVELATGELRWRRALLEEDENLVYGLSASPRFHGDTVVVQDRDSVWACDVRSGEPRWQALAEELAYATPQLGRVLGDEVWVVTTARRIVGLEAQSGAELWSFPWRVTGGLACTQPLIVGGNSILVSAGYGSGSRLFALARTDDGIEASMAWRSPRFKTHYNEPVLLGDHAYGLAGGVLTCIEAASGKRVWKAGRYGYGQLLAVGDRAVLIDEQGTVHALELGPGGPVERGSFQALEGEMMLNVPALAHGRLFVRNERELAVYDLRASVE